MAVTVDATVDASGDGSAAAIGGDGATFGIATLGPWDTERDAQLAAVDQQRLGRAELAVREGLHRPEGRVLRLVAEEVVWMIRGARIFVLLVRWGTQERGFKQIEGRRPELVIHLDAEDLLELGRPW